MPQVGPTASFDIFHSRLRRLSFVYPSIHPHAPRHYLCSEKSLTETGLSPSPCEYRCRKLQIRREHHEVDVMNVATMSFALGESKLWTCFLTYMIQHILSAGCRRAWIKNKSEAAKRNTAKRSPSRSWLPWLRSLSLLPPTCAPVDGLLARNGGEYRYHERSLHLGLFSLELGMDYQCRIF